MSKKYLYISLFVVLFLNIRVWGQPGCVNVTITTNGGNDFTLPCNQPCTNIDAVAVQTSGETSNYSVSSIPYAPPYPYNIGNPILVNIDDRWSSVITLPFTFCFYGVNYNEIIAGSNGVVSFDLTPANGYCPWQFSATCPSFSLIPNAIFGVYHDIDPAVSGLMYYAILGTYPCRTFVVSWYQIPLFLTDCNSYIATHQIVLYETSNIIEVYVQDKPVCTLWNDGNALIGIQNATGTLGLTPPGRNTSVWTAQNEAWRFTPIGSSFVGITWYEGSSQIGSGNTIYVCPTGTTTYTAQANYSTCFGATVTVDDHITVSKASGSVSIAPVNPVICAGGSVGLTASGSTTYSWAPAAGLNQTTGSAVAASPTMTTTYTVTGVNPGCTTTNSVTVTVNPQPQINNMSLTACSGAGFTSTPVNGTNGVVPAGTTYSWPAPVVAGITGAISGTNAASISGTLTNTTNAPINVVYTVTPVTGTCQGAPYTLTVTVNPLPAVTNMSATICSGGTFNLSPVNGVNGVVPSGTVYNWTAPVVTGITGATAGTNAASVSGTLTNTTNAPVNVTYTVGPHTASCTGATFTATVTVNPTPTVTVPSNVTVCHNATIAATNFASTPSGGSFAWTNSNTAVGLTSGGTGNIASFIASNTGTTPISATITVTPTVNTCQGTSSAYTITVNPVPSVNVPANITVCTNGTVPTVNFTSMPAGGTFSWTNSNTAIGLGANGTGNIPSFTATNTGNNPITATITVVPVANNCTGISSSFTITVSPVPTVSVPANITVCKNSPVAATNFISSPAGGSFAWTNSNTAIGLVASGTGNIPGFTAANQSNSPVTATISVIPTVNGCTGTPSTYTITVNPTPVVSVPANINVCSSGSVPATSFSSSPAGGIFAWTNSNTAIGLGVSGTGNITAFTAVNTTNAPITATITVSATVNSCPGTPSSYTITVNPVPTVSVPSNITICNGGSIPGTNFVSTPAGGTFAWTNSNNAIGLAASGTGNIGSYTAANNGAVPITATIAVVPTVNNCPGTSSSFTITVNPTPSVIVPSNISICNGDVVPGTSFTSPVSGATFSWTSSNTTIGLSAGGTGDISSFTAVNTGNVVQTSTIAVTPSANNCTGIASSYMINVNPTPQISFVTMPQLCVTSPVLTLSQASPAGGTYSGPGITGNSFDPAAAGIGTHTITYDFTHPVTGCSNSGTTQIVVTSGLTITVTPNNPFICEGSNVLLTAGGAFNYSWQPDSGLSANSGANVLASPGSTTIYTVNGSNPDGCSGSTTVAVGIYSVPVLSVVPLPAEGCSPLFVSFSYLPAGSVIDTNTLSWNFGDLSSPDNTSAATNPGHLYHNRGTYTVYLTAHTSDGCLVTATDTVSALLKPVADFYANPVMAYSDNTKIDFYDLSFGANSWYWNFNDPASFSENYSSLQNPVHMFTDTGKYRVQLIAYSNHFCSDTVEKPVMIIPQTVIFVPNAFTPDKDGLNEIFKPVITGIDKTNYKFYIFDRWGKEQFFTKDLEEGWDGLSNGKKSELGVYVYIILYRNLNGKEFKLKGIVTLVR
ncbi:MAG TPA: gliding motility-associated C-terminal domain-containing protein [Bacteroidales bacterium]|nr:gliding motility-associated C-terminal domain-containing protein [Bacteroidales bacterium]